MISLVLKFKKKTLCYLFVSFTVILIFILYSLTKISNFEKQYNDHAQVYHNEYQQLLMIKNYVENGLVDCEKLIIIGKSKRIGEIAYLQGVQFRIVNLKRVDDGVKFLQMSPSDIKKKTFHPYLVEFFLFSPPSITKCVGSLKKYYSN